MKTSRKLAAALAVFAAGSAFLGSLPAQAKGIDFGEVKIVVRSHHDDRLPPPQHRGHRVPPELHRHHRDVPPPPHHHRHPGDVPPPPHHHRHPGDVPPPPHHHQHYR